MTSQLDQESRFLSDLALPQNGRYRLRSDAIVFHVSCNAAAIWIVGTHLGHSVSIFESHSGHTHGPALQKGKYYTS